MAAFEIQPTFDNIQNVLTFPTDQINVINRQRYGDNFDRYQSAYGVYAYMTMNKDMKYVVHQVTGRPYMWRNQNSCVWNPQQAVTRSQNEIDTCRVELNLEHCFDENFDNVFAFFNTWSNQGDVSDDVGPEGEELIQATVDVILSNASLGLRTILEAGQYHDFSNANFLSGVPSSIEDEIKASSETCQGWISAVLDLASDYGHLNVADAIDASDVENNNYTGSVVDLFDTIMDEAPAELQGLVDEGDVGPASPVILVTPSILKAVSQAWVATTNAFATGGFKPRVSMEMITGNEGRAAKQYFIDGIPVVPIKGLNTIEKHLEGKSHGMYVTAAGNIQLGTNFASIPVAEQDDVAIQIQKSPVLKDKGKWYFYSASLVAAAIADINYIAGAIEYIEDNEQ